MDEKLNKQRWLTAGLQTLAEDGLQALRIMPIAQRLGVTKGSFYWHFKNLRDYQAALLEEWERGYTQEAIDWLRQDQSPPRDKLRNWIVGAAYADFKLDRALRTWAQNDPLAREVRNRVDRQRMEFLAGLLGDVGWSPADAETLARWTYASWVGYTLLDGPPATEQQLKLFLSILLPK